MSTGKIALAVAFACAAICPAPARAAAWDKPGYTLTFQDEFDGSTLDTGKWGRRFKWGQAVINNELQAYTDDQFAVASGILNIVGEEKSATYAGMTMNYASGLIASVHHQTYGYFEARMKFPKGQGLWPAFWLLGENGTQGVNEIDILEFLGHDVDTVYMTLHWGESYSVGHESDSTEYSGPDFSADFHTYAVDWQPDSIVWYIDGTERHSHSGLGVPSVEMYMIANLAIGGAWPGNPDGTTMFPANYAIDYIRAYQKSDAAGSGGTNGSGGTSGSAGAPANGGTSGNAGSAAGGAAAGGGGASAGGVTGTSGGGALAGSSSAGDSPVGAAPSSDSGGCGCRTARGAGNGSWLLALGLFALVRRHRTRRA